MKVKNRWAARILIFAIVGSPLAALADTTTPPVGGETTVQLSSSFVSALTSLHVIPAAVGPGRLYDVRGTTYAAFPITTGAIDLKATRVEIDHAGGLSLTAGDTVVTLSGFLIQVDPKSESVLTGLVAVNGTLVGRITLFDLSLAKAKVWVENRFIDLSNVALKLDETAAEALSNAFHTSIPAVQLGVAEVRTIKGPADLRRTFQSNNLTSSAETLPDHHQVPFISRTACDAPSSIHC